MSVKEEMRQSPAERQQRERLRSYLEAAKGGKLYLGRVAAETGLPPERIIDWIRSHAV